MRTKGTRMRIGTTGLPEIVAPVASTEVVASKAPAQSSLTASSPPPAPLQSEVLAPAVQAMAAMPEIDQAKVAAVRDALSKGEITFDAGKLAGLISRFHRGQ